jgi:hypothetical protein
MSVRATIDLGLTVVESVGSDAAGYANSARNSVTFDGGGTNETLTASSTPPVTAHAVGQQAMSGGTGSIDLRALTGLNGAAVDLNGLKPRAILFENPATNANPITVSKGASNGFTGLGSSFSLTLQPGQKVLLRLGASGTAVSGTVKTFDLAGTGSQALKYQIVAGA